MERGNADQLVEVDRVPDITWPWAIVLCRFSDVPTTTRPREYYEDLLTRSGTGGLADYWRAVSHNALDVTGSRVFGWFDMSHASSELAALTFPGDRWKPVQWGVEAAQAHGVSLGAFKSVLIVQNAGRDHGAAGNGILIVHKDPGLCELGFIAHEMGHGFGLPHSWSANPDTGYGDGWDLMSFATTTFQFPIVFQGAAGEATVGLNARNLEALGALPPGRTWSPPGPDFSAEVLLEPLNQPPIGNRGVLIASIPSTATRPARLSGSEFTIEFRRKSGWDQGIPRDAVLVHERRTDGLSYLQPTSGSDFVRGGEFVTPDPAVYVRVNRVDGPMGRASVHVWDIPDGCVRREARSLAEYVIEGGSKRLIVSARRAGRALPAARVVPEHGLASLPDGPDFGSPSVPRLPGP